MPNQQSKTSRSEFRLLVDEMDKEADKLFDKLRGNPIADRIFYTASQLGDHGLLWQLLAAVKALFGGEKHAKNFRRLSVALMIESVLVNGVLKSLFPRNRPDTENGESRPHYLRQPITASFPSGHASAATLAAVLLRTGKRRPLFTWLLAGIIASSRGHVKIHHASDILAGAAVGYCLGKFVKAVWRLK